MKGSKNTISERCIIIIIIIMMIINSVNSPAGLGTTFLGGSSSSELLSLLDSFLG